MTGLGATVLNPMIMATVWERKGCRMDGRLGVMGGMGMQKEVGGIGLVIDRRFKAVSHLLGAARRDRAPGGDDLTHHGCVS